MLQNVIILLIYITSDRDKEYVKYEGQHAEKKKGNESLNK